MIKKIKDIKDMPNFNDKVTNCIDSVSRGKILLETKPFGIFPYCQEHGALLMVSPDGIWRCPSCNEGCYYG